MTPHLLYLSTACLHDMHKLCGGAQHERGDDSAPHCKYCSSPCVCGCHDGLEKTEGVRQHWPGCRREDGHLGWCGT